MRPWFRMSCDNFAMTAAQASLLLFFSHFIYATLRTHYSRLAHALASSFNFQGRVKKTFYVLTDDKIGSGPRLRPHSLAKESSKDPEPASNMETDSSSASSDPAPTGGTVPSQPVVPQTGMSLSAKLAAKRKAHDTDSTDSPSKTRR
jgi:hypothetical protein